MKRRFNIVSIILIFLSLSITILYSGCKAGRNSSGYNNQSGRKRNKNKHVLISSAHPEYPPVMWKIDSNIVGIGPDLLQLLFNDLNIKVESNYTGPWTRVLENCKFGKIDAISALFYTEERSEYYDFTIGYMNDPVAVFTKKNTQLKFEKWEDLIGLNGVTTHGDSWGEEFDTYSENFLTITKVSRVNQCFRMLEANRADYMIFSLYAGLIHIKKLNLTDSLIALPHYVSTPELHIGFSKLSPYRKHIPKLNKKIEELKKDGTIDTLIKKHLSK